MKTYRISSSEWRRKFYDSKSGIPSLKEINAEIDKGAIPGNSIAGKYVVYCDAQYEPLWGESIAKPPEQTPIANPKAISNPIAKRILAQASN